MSVINIDEEEFELLEKAVEKAEKELKRLRLAYRLTPAQHERIEKFRKQLRKGLNNEG